MKDSRIGTYGATALVLVLGLRVALVSTLLQGSAVRASLALIGANVVGRGCAVAVMALLPYAGDAEHAKAKPLATAVPRVSVVAAIALTALAVARQWLGQRLGGYTGDTLGAAEQLTEVAVLLVLAVS